MHILDDTLLDAIAGGTSGLPAAEPTGAPPPAGNGSGPGLGIEPPPGPRKPPKGPICPPGR